MGDISLNCPTSLLKAAAIGPRRRCQWAAILPTGRSPYKINRDTDLSTGSGLYSVSLGVNMSKSIDPAMVFGSIGCGYALNRNDIDQNMNGAMLDSVEPGMSYNAAIGLAYAISYALSMNVSFNYGYNMSTEYDFTNAADSTTPSYSTGSLGYRYWLAHFAANDAVVGLVYRIDEQ